jgi:hypothetical protein
MSDIVPCGETSPLQGVDESREIDGIVFRKIAGLLQLPFTSVVLTDTMKGILVETIRREDERFRQQLRRTVMEFGIRDIYDEEDRQPLNQEEDLEQEEGAMKPKRRGRKYPKKAMRETRPANVAAESDY